MSFHPEPPGVSRESKRALARGLRLMVQKGMDFGSLEVGDDENPSWWNKNVENMYRCQVAGYRNEANYLQKRRLKEIEKWPSSGLIRMLVRWDGKYYYFGEERECPKLRSSDITKALLREHVTFENSPYTDDTLEWAPVLSTMTQRINDAYEEVFSRKVSTSVEEEAASISCLKVKKSRRKTKQSLKLINRWKSSTPLRRKFDFFTKKKRTVSLISHKYFYIRKRVRNNTNHRKFSDMAVRVGYRKMLESKNSPVWGRSKSRLQKRTNIQICMEKQELLTETCSVVVNNNSNHTTHEINLRPSTVPRSEEKYYLPPLIEQLENKKPPLSLKKNNLNTTNKNIYVHEICSGDVFFEEGRNRKYSKGKKDKTSNYETRKICCPWSYSTLNCHQKNTKVPSDCEKIPRKETLDKYANICSTNFREIKNSLATSSKCLNIEAPANPQYPKSSDYVPRETLLPRRSRRNSKMKFHQNCTRSKTDLRQTESEIIFSPAEASVIVTKLTLRPKTVLPKMYDKISHIPETIVPQNTRREASRSDEFVTSSDADISCASALENRINRRKCDCVKQSLHVDFISEKVCNIQTKLNVGVRKQFFENCKFFDKDQHISINYENIRL